MDINCMICIKRLELLMVGKKGLKKSVKNAA